MRLAFPGLMAALAEGATVVVPTRILASVATEQFNHQQMDLGLECWQRPKILSLDAWMTNSWQQVRFSGCNIPALLSPAQERELWRQIIQDRRPDLFDVAAMASLAQRASRILAEYEIPTDRGDWSEHPDAFSFLEWHREFRRRLQDMNWMTRSGLWHHLPDWIAKAVFNPGPIVFAALTTVSPGLKSLSRALADQVRQVGIASPAAKPSPTGRAFDCVAHEFEHAARAARHLIEVERLRSIGILVADFKAQAQDVVRIFNEVFYPSSVEQADDIHIQFNSQSRQPLIANAMLLLELAHPRIHHASAGAVLRSPFMAGAAEERSLRAIAGAKLQQARELDFSLTDLERVTRGCPALQKILKRVTGVIAKLGTEMSLPRWSAAFSDVLEASGWPAVEDMTQAEQQAVEQWNRALSELASLGLISPPVFLNQALAQLRSILSRPAEQGDWNSAVQILDAGAAEGIEFDRTVVLNATEEAWPQPSTLSPLIPYKLQRQHHVPGSSPESLNEERVRQTKWLCTSARVVEISQSGTLSPLLQPYVYAATSEAAVWTGHTAVQSFSPAVLESHDDSQAPPLVQNGDLRGGSSIIKSQSLCPFRAFAEYRLNARGDDEASFGFDALQRGNFVHKALEILWRKLETQDRLRQMAEDQLRDLVDECVSEAVNDDNSGPIRALTTTAERERLRSVVLDWLNIEKSRSQPFSVEYVEQDKNVEIAGLTLKLRVDRVDRLRNGSLVLIDYKSGLQSREKLKGERPKEPQLLVYATCLDEPVEGLFFAELRNRNARAVGHGQGKHFGGSSVTDHKHRWDQFLTDAEQSVHNLAREFLRGEAAVNPQKGACEYCRVKPICRIRTAGAAAEDEE